MSTTGEQVQVTPELLASVEEKASAATQGRWACWNGWEGHDGLHRALRVGRADGGGIWASDGGDVVGTREDLEHVATACPSVVLALVQRIRELESTVADLEAFAEASDQLP